jgi:hypothetical protein
MPTVYTKGQRVSLPKFGAGTVREVLAGGAILRVWFDVIDGILPVNASEISPVGDSVSGPRNGIAPPRPVVPPSVPTEPTAFDGRRLAVECLRQGLPPPRKLLSFTVGHKKARDRIDSAISRAAQGQGSVLVVKADYGQGKSHWGRLARELAIAQGLVTMNVELDGEGLSFSRTTTGTRVISTLFGSAMMPQGDDSEYGHLVPGLGPVLRRAAAKLRGRVPPGLRSFGPFLSHADKLMESEEVVETLEDYLSGEKNRTDASTELGDLMGERVYLETLGMTYGDASARRAAQADQVARVVELGVAGGAKGGLIVLDEIDHDLKDPYDRTSVLNMLGQFARIARDGPIVVVMLTPTELGLSVKGAMEISLEPLDTSELNALVKKTIGTYAAAFPAPVLERGREELMDALLKLYEDEYRDAGWGPRFFVRSTIESCEAARQRKLESLAEVSVV